MSLSEPVTVPKSPMLSPLREHKSDVEENQTTTSESDSSRVRYLVSAKEIVKIEASTPENLLKGLYHPEREFVIDDQYQPTKKLGEGMKSLICAAKRIDRDELVVIKKVKNPLANRGERVLNEIQMMQKFAHPNLLRLMDVIDPRSAEEMQDGIYLITEFMQTDLCRLLKQPTMNLTENHSCWITFQILCGLKHMHERGFVHGDIRPAHILVNSSCGVKIADFGLTTKRGQPLRIDPNSSQNSKNMWYASPEEILSSSKEYGVASDLWSVGCILAELLLKKPLFPGSVGIDQLRKIFEKLGAPTEDDIVHLSSKNNNVSRVLDVFASSQDFPKSTTVQEIFSVASDDARDLLSKMLVLNPTNRITIDQALEHAFFRQVYPESERLFSESSGNSADVEQPQAADIEGQLRQEINKIRRP